MHFAPRQKRNQFRVRGGPPSEIRCHVEKIRRVQGSFQMMALFSSSQEKSTRPCSRTGLVDLDPSVCQELRVLQVPKNR